MRRETIRTRNTRYWGKSRSTSRFFFHQHASTLNSSVDFPRIPCARDVFSSRRFAASWKFVEYEKLNFSRKGQNVFTIGKAEWQERTKCGNVRNCDRKEVKEGEKKG